MVNGTDSRPLDGITVIDFSRYRAGPWTSQILGTLGAEIIKIERPKVGDPTRHQVPEHRGMGTTFISNNRNKQSVAIDIKSDEGREMVESLIAESDILVENFSTRTMERLGLNYGYVSSKLNEDIIYLSIKGYGETGPYKDRKGVDMVMQAEGGLMSVTGHEGDYVKVGQAIGDICTGLYGCIGALSALFQRKDTGEGQKVEIDIFGTIISIMEEYITRYGITGEDPKPLGSRHQSIDPYELFETKDGYMVICCVTNDHWETLVTEILDEKEDRLLEFDSYQKRRENYDEIMDVLRPKMREKTNDEWQTIFEDYGLPNGPLNKVSDLVNDPHAQKRDDVIEFDDPYLGQILLHGHPFHFSNFDATPIKGPPQLGQHTTEVLSKHLGLGDEEISKLEDENIIDRPDD